MTEYIVDVTNMESGDYVIAKEEIVRCEDCVYYNIERGGLCKRFTGIMYAIHTKANGFCAWGERRES